jgi:hypothetical protein
MTGRQLIQKIAETCDDLDKDIQIFLLTRDEWNCVVKKEVATNYWINGKIIVEKNSLTKTNLV